MQIVSPTPIEQYKVKGKVIHVKREDLAALPPAPPLAKLRGIHILLKRLLMTGVNVVGCFEASVSSVGHAVAAACLPFQDLHCVVSYVSTRHRPITPSVQYAKELGAELLPLNQNFSHICHAQTKRIVEARGGYMIPFGFEFPEAIDAIAEEAATIPTKYIKNGTVVVCCGSGVTLVGIYKGLRATPQKYLGVSSGRTVRNIRACLNRHGITNSHMITLVDPIMSYRTACDIACPFPSDPFYDRKAWQYVRDTIEHLPEPILFWNVGGHSFGT